MTDTVKPKPSIAILGAGGFGREVSVLIEQINQVAPKWDLIGYFDDNIRPGTSINRYPVIGGLNELNHWPEKLAVIISIGTPKTKAGIVHRLHGSQLWYPVLIHPSVIMGSSSSVSIGSGSIICAGAIITTNIRIGRHVTLNLSCTVGHDCDIGDYCSLMPACNISGEVRVGRGSFLGTGAKVINQKKVGEHSVIGAGAVVTTDIPANVTAVGVPAKILQR